MLPSYRNSLLICSVFSAGHFSSFVDASVERFVYEDNVESLFEKYCFSCHGPDEQENGLRVDTLDRDFVNGRDGETWHDMHDSTSNQFSKALGLGTQHELAHGAGKPGGFIRQGKWNVCLAENLARFLQKMADTPEGDGSLLDNTMVLMGTSNSRTHNNHNYPLIFAGGNNMGFKHNQYLTYEKNGEDMPMSDLLFTMLNRMGISDTGFSDSVGDLSDLYV